MEVWRIILYAVAALLAIRSLTALMTAYRNRLLWELRQREEREQKAAKKQAMTGKVPS